ncbi:MAG: protein kinase [Candidatus Aminicenantes bacterium]|nr:protein kinase [Candidatus Aminicenantes bacterium]
MKCLKCSFVNPETQHFCGHCGTRLISDEESEATRTSTIDLPPKPWDIGSMFAERYQIIEELGKGGMGRVFRALDKKLDEEIAVKFIRPDLAQDAQSVERFRIELKAARQVIHKNVARMFDLNEQEGIPYITMEYVRGENLKSLIRKVGHLDARQAIRIARQVAEGLSEAHRIGVIHRDLKPHNIMIDEEGAARITDFGLAGLRKSDDATLSSLGMGTPSYVSPEQVEGGPTDGRSDIYSLGIVFYEMLTGETPFQGDTPYSIALKRLTKAPPDPRDINPEIPEALVQVMMNCLQKDPGRRYQSANELAVDLKALGEDFSMGILPGARPGTIGIRARRWILARRVPLAFLAAIVLGIASYFIFNPPARPSPWKASIAVLPIEDLNPRGEMMNVWYGLQSEISAKLHNIPELKVVSIPSQSSDEYQGKNYREIGKDLAVEFLLKLTLLTEGTKLRVRLRLIEVETASDFKSYEYLTELESIYEFQDEISRQTARALRVNLIEDRLRVFKKREPGNLLAYNHYLEGKRITEEIYLRSYHPEDYELAVSHYEKAIGIDPHYAMAYWGLGNAHEARYYSTRKEDKNNPADWQRMIENYNRAYEIEPEIAETNLGVGWVHFNVEDNVRASQHFKRAFELDPNSFIVNQDVGAFLRSVGLYHEAVKYLSRAAELNPHYVSTRLMLSSSLMFLGQFDTAIGAAEEAIKEDPTSFEGRFYCAIGLIMLNRLNEAQEEIDKARRIDPQRDLKIPQALLWAAQGEKEKALELLSERKSTSVRVFAYLLLGMKEEAIHIIEEGIEHGFEESGYYHYAYPMLAENPVFKSLRREPHFQEILKREKAKHEEKMRNYAKF